MDNRLVKREISSRKHFSKLMIVNPYRGTMTQALTTRQAEKIPVAHTSSASSIPSKVTNHRRLGNTFPTQNFRRMILTPTPILTCVESGWWGKNLQNKKNRQEYKTRLPVDSAPALQRSVEDAISEGTSDISLRLNSYGNDEDLHSSQLTSLERQYDVYLKPFQNKDHASLP